MKIVDIKLGNTYSNGRGKYRKITEEGPQYKTGIGQSDADCVEYTVMLPVRGPAVPDVWKHDGRPKTGHMTRRAFAAWAKSEGIPT